MVRVWTSAANNTKTAVDLMYLLLQIEAVRASRMALLGWIDEDYFTDWTLSQQLAQSWAGFGGGKGRKPRPGWEQDELYLRLRSAFDAFIDDPFGAQGDEIAVSLARLATDVLREEDETRRLALVKDWLADLSGNNLAAGRGITAGDLDREAPRLEFTLAVAAAVLTSQGLPRSLLQHVAVRGGRHRAGIGEPAGLPPPAAGPAAADPACRHGPRPWLSVQAG